MDKSTKLYKLAMKKYQNGYVDEALELCEQCISINLKNSAALNLKGLLLYLKGELEGARRIWRLNKDINKDSVSQKYIEDSIKDEEKKYLYETALHFIKEIKIKEALKLLRYCEESDYNAINVGNAITSCLIRQGNYEEAIGYIKKVLNLDRKNKIAKESKSILIEYGIMKNSASYKKVTITSCLILLFLITLYGVLNRKDIFNKYNSSKDNSSSGNIIKNEVEEVKEEKKSKDIEIFEDKRDQKKETVEDTQKPGTFPFDAIRAALDEKKYEELYNYYNEWKNKALSVNEKIMISKVEETLKKEGVQFFYVSGNRYMKDKANNKALESLKKAYDLGEGDYLYQHIVFILASVYERVEDFNSALRLYEEYHNSYIEGDYGDVVLYNMVNIYKNVDENKAKQYGIELINRYPKSLYNNSRIRQVEMRSRI